MILISDLLIHPWFLFTTIIQSFYFLQHTKFRDGFIVGFPKMQWLFVCPDAILISLLCEWYASCSRSLQSG
jgi:hypothetical protein